METKLKTKNFKTNPATEAGRNNDFNTIVDSINADGSNSNFNKTVETMNIGGSSLTEMQKSLENVNVEGMINPAFPKQASKKTMNAGGDEEETKESKPVTTAKPKKSLKHINWKLWGGVGAGVILAGIATFVVIKKRKKGKK